MTGATHASPKRRFPIAQAWSRRALVAEAVVALIAASLAVRFLPFRRIAAWASLPASGPEPGDAAGVVAVVRWAVNGCADRAPWRAVCFQRGVAAHAMLRRRGVRSTLHYGVAPSPGDGLKAHVWVTAGAEGVIGMRDAAGYARVASFPPAA